MTRHARLCIFLIRLVPTGGRLLCQRMSVCMCECDEMKSIRALYDLDNIVIELKCVPYGHAL